MKTQTARLTRNKNTYEFLIRDPHGTSAVEGYRRAARHFGFCTLEDPTTVGTDTFRLLVHKSRQKLREAARVLSRAYSSDDQALIDEAETWLALKSDVTWFDHDWSWWNQDQDEGALEHLGWIRKVVESGGTYRVTLRLAGSRAPR